MRPEWDPRIATLVTPLTGSGVEGLTLEAIETPQSQHLLDKGYNGVTFQCAYDCWADDITVRHVDNGFGLVAASACTLRRTRVEGRGSHHPYFCREGSHDNLVEDFTIAQRTVPAPAGTQLHGINVEGLSSYNVWSRGRDGDGHLRHPPRHAVRQRPHRHHRQQQRPPRRRRERGPALRRPVHPLERHRHQ